MQAYVFAGWHLPSPNSLPMKPTVCMAGAVVASPYMSARGAAAAMRPPSPSPGCAGGPQRCGTQTWCWSAPWAGGLSGAAGRPRAWHPPCSAGTHARPLAAPAGTWRYQQAGSGARVVAVVERLGLASGAKAARKRCSRCTGAAAPAGLISCQSRPCACILLPQHPPTHPTSLPPSFLAVARVSTNHECGIAQ